jgi:hypothetical protein
MNIKALFYLTGLILILSTSIIFLWLFFSAYLSESKTILMDINFYHEANIELILAFITILSGIYFFYTTIKAVYNGEI